MPSNPDADSSFDASDLIDLIFETTEMPIAVLDLECRFVRVNEAYARATSRAATSLPGLGHFDLYPHAENERLFREVLRCDRAHVERAKAFEHPDQLERGTTYWDWTFAPLHDAETRIVGGMLSLLDVTDHVRTRTELALGRMQLRQLIDAMFEPAVIERQGEILLANPGFAELTGERSVPPGGPIGAWIEPVTGDVGSARVRTADGSVRAQVVSTLVQTERGAARVHLFRPEASTSPELDELRALRRRETGSRLAAALTHDINNMLSLLSGSAYLLRAGEGLPAPATQHLETIELAIKRGAALTRRLRLMHRDAPPPAPSVHLRSALDEDLPLLRTAIGSGRRVTIGEVPAVTLRVDPDELSQVLLNLALNAGDAMPRDGTFSIDAHVAPAVDGGADEPCLVLRVADDGPGLPTELGERIFDPFVTTKTTERGTGLGLAIVRGIVKQAGGTIVSVGSARGAAFEIRLPSSRTNTPTTEIRMPANRRAARVN